MRKIAAAALIVSITSACAPQFVYTRPGATQVDFNHDKAVCEYQAASATASGGNFGMQTAIGAGIAQGMKQAELQEMCMRAAGWQQVRAQASPATVECLRPDGGLIRASAKYCLEADGVAQ